jgi:hypothetical protein
MFNNRKDDDVIVITEEDVTYETPEESGDPADSAAPAGDKVATADSSGRPGSDATGRFDTVTMPGDAAATPETADPQAAAPETGAPETGAPETAAPETAARTDADTAFGSGRGSSVSGRAADDDPAAAPVTAAGTDGAGDADGTEAADDTVASGTVNGTGTGTGTGSAIPMPGAAPEDADAPVAASAAPAASAAAPAAAAAPVAASATPAAAPAAGPPADDSNWPQIQALFVDDPLSAVRQAADVAGGALAALVASANNREQTMRDSWQSDTIGTEDLRTALRSYRDLAGRLSELSKNL